MQNATKHDLSRYAPLREHLDDLNRQFPRAGEQAEHMRSIRGTGLFPNWPDWCYLTMGTWGAIVAGQIGRLDVLLMQQLAAFGSWKLTQGIYRFDPTLYDALCTTPVTGDLPCEIFYQLPEWCMYIDTPGLQFGDDVLDGFFAHLEFDQNASDRHELRLLLRTTDGTYIPVPLHLGPWSLLEAVSRARTIARSNLDSGSPAQQHLISIEMDQPMADAYAPLLSLLIYLCSESNEIGTALRRPANPVPKKTKRGIRLFQAEKMTTWPVGVRLGAALRQAYAASAARSDEPREDGPKVRPHIRRAHWHGVRSGPRKRPDGSAIPAGDRAFTVRWQPPLPVNVQDFDALPAVVRQVGQ